MPRRSSDSARTAPKFPTHRKDRSIQDRSMSMPSAPNPARSILEQQKRVSKPSFGSSVSTLPVEGRVSPAHNPSNRTPVIRKSQNIYPALLSRVAQAFRERIPICDRVKDGLTYKDAFDGREAVDKMAYIIKTTDRNLALLLGRALDAQKFFHDVTYDHRLRDSANELYQFRTKLPSPFVSGELPQQEPSPESLVSGVTNALFHPEVRGFHVVECRYFSHLYLRFCIYSSGSLFLSGRKWLHISYPNISSQTLSRRLNLFG